MLRRCFVLTAVVALAVGVNQAWAADEESEAPVGTHQGKVVKVDGAKLTMSDKDGKQHTHAVPAGAQIVIDGKAAKLADLKAGQTIKVTAEKKDNKNVITKIEGSSS